MKKYYKLSLLIFSVALIFLASCETDDVNPFNGDDRDKYVGTWNCSETSESGDQISYTIKIGKSENSVEVWIEGFAAIGFGDTVTGIVAGGNITVPSQSPCQGWVVDGKVVYQDNDYMTGEHEVIAGGDKVKYTAEYTR